MKRCKRLSVVVISFLCLVSFLGFNTLAPAIAGAADEQKPAAAAKEKKAAKKSVAKKKKGPAPLFRTAEAVVKLEGKTPSVVLIGTGFAPEKEIRILFTDAEGMQTDVGYALKPELTVDKMGNFFTEWGVGEFMKAKLVKAGIFTLTVTDGQFKPIAETHVVFVAVKAEKKGDKKDKGDKGDKGDKKDKGDKEKKKE